MFVVVYQWTIKKGAESAFEDAWAIRTEEIKQEHGSLGSRLHVNDNGQYVAYASWPSRESYEAAGKNPKTETDAQVKMRRATKTVDVVYTMIVVKDLIQFTP